MRSLAFWRCYKIGLAISGLWGGHLCPLLPQFFFVGAPGQLVKCGLTLLIEGHCIHVVLAQSSHCQEEELLKDVLCRCSQWEMVL